MNYSIIILLEDPYADFPQFVKNLLNVFAARGDSFEILIMANGTGDFLRKQLTEFQGFNYSIKAFEFNTKTTQAVCLQAGLKESSGEIIVACGSYQQITSDSFNQLLDALDEGTDIISPWRQGRVDHSFNRFQSKVFNTIVRTLIKSDLHDLSCAVKIFRREVLEETRIYGNMYRFLPIVAAQKGFKTKEVKCQNFQERGKTGFYPLSSYATRLIDISTLFFNTRFIKKPLRFFSSVGLGSFLIGLFIAFYVFVEKIFMGYPVGDRPALLLAIFFMVLGIQTASIGLLGEIITFTHGRHRKEYTIEKMI